MVRKLTTGPSHHNDANMKGKLVAFKGAGQPLELMEFPVTALAPGEVLVKNLYTTLCGSDIHTYCGVRTETCPTVLGHEIVGEIVSLHEGYDYRDLRGQPLQNGDIITWSIFSSDPDSAYSRQGIPQKGDNLFKYGHALLSEADAFHGGLAEYCKLRAHTGILKIPQAIPVPLAATINCAMATVAGAIRMAGDLKGKKVLIFGMGLLGISCVAMCREAGAEWVGAADISEKRLESSHRFGASDVFPITESREFVTTVKRSAKTENVDVVFDMSGAPEAMEAGIDLLGIGGVAVWVGAVFRNRKIQVDAERVIRNLITIKGIHNYNFDDLNYALNFLAESHVKYPFASVVEREFPLADAEKAFQYAVSNKPIRVGIRINEAGVGQQNLKS